MHERTGQILRALIIATALAWLPAAPASAQSVGAPAAMVATPEARQLGTRLAHKLFSVIDFKALILQKSPDLASMFDSVKVRPEWPGLMKDALLEQFDHDMPVMERLVGDQFANTFTIGELRAGVAFLDGPAGPDFLALVAAGGRGGPRPTISKEGLRSMDRFIHTQDGASFMAKLGKMEPMIDAIQADYLAVFLPDLFISFGEKARAAEAARTTGH